jgi:transcriptional regulator GlxA family with amidase domain
MEVFFPDKPHLRDTDLCTAQHLLRQSRISLADIALGCGFSSQSYMTDIFRQQLGITPQQYRRSGSHKS